MISLDDAFDIIARNITPLTGAELCDVEESLGRITADEIIAPRSLPPFTNTGVDGYAVRHSEARTRYTMVGASFAGEPFDGLLEEGQAVRIATGAVLPAGADTVIMQENCEVQDGTLTVRDLPAKGSNIRPAGGDIKQGSAALKAGVLLRPQEIAFLTALGIEKVRVLRKIRIAIASTGLELGKPGDSLKPGQIVDTNTSMLVQMLSQASLSVSRLDPMPDDLEITRSSLKNAADKYDVIITTGGVSVGDRDFVRDILHQDGEVLFWRVAIRPGKPVLVGRFGASIMIGLPGNPVSAFVTSHLLVRAVLRRLWNQDVTLPSGFNVQLANDIEKPGHLRSFPRAQYRDGLAIPYPDQSSNLYTSIAEADGILDLPEGKTNFAKGDNVIFRPLGGLL